MPLTPIDSASVALAGTSDARADRAREGLRDRLWLDRRGPKRVP